MILDRLVTRRESKSSWRYPRQQCNCPQYMSTELSLYGRKGEWALHASLVRIHNVGQGRKEMAALTCSDLMSYVDIQ